MGIKGRIMKFTFNFKFLKSISYALFLRVKRNLYTYGRKGEFPFLLFRTVEFKKSTCILDNYVPL